VLNADAWKAASHFATEPPMGGRGAVIQQSRLGEEKRADANGAQAAHARRHFVEPSRERGIADGPAAEPTDEQHRVARAIDVAEVILGDKGQHAAFARNRMAVCARDHVHGVDFPAGKAIHRVKHLKRTDKIELIDRGDDDGDDAAAGGLLAGAGMACGCHAFTYYDARPTTVQGGKGDVADFDECLSEIVGSAPLGLL